MCVYVWARVCVYVCMYVCMHARTHARTYARTHARTHAYTCVPTHARMHACTECCEPLQVMSEAINTSNQAKIDALVACNFDETTGELVPGCCATLSDALRKLKVALKLRAAKPKPNHWSPKDVAQPPVWAPPRMVSTTADDGKGTPYVAIKFLKFHLAGEYEDDDKKPKGAQTGDKLFKENQDLLGGI